MDNIDRLASSGYVPNDQDILRSYTCTVGTYEMMFDLTWLKSVFDVGGSRSQRRKWTYVSSNVHCVVFVAALSGYDECLFEDQTSVRECLIVFLFYLPKDSF